MRRFLARGGGSYVVNMEPKWSLRMLSQARIPGKSRECAARLDAFNRLKPLPEKL